MLGTVAEVLTLLCSVGNTVFFSKVLLDKLQPGTLFEWCKVNRGAFVVTR